MARLFIIRLACKPEFFACPTNSPNFSDSDRLQKHCPVVDPPAPVTSEKMWLIDELQASTRVCLLGLKFNTCIKKITCSHLWVGLVFPRRAGCRIPPLITFRDGNRAKVVKELQPCSLASNQGTLFQRVPISSTENISSTEDISSKEDSICMGI